MDEKPPRTRMRGPARRAVITAAALEVFAKKGYHGASLSEIAVQAGVARTVLYDHFPSKRSLLLAVMQEQNTALMRHVGARITGAGPAEVRLRSTIDAYFSFTETGSAGRRLLFDHADEDDAEIRTVRQGIRESRARAATALLAEDMRALGVDPREPIAEAMVEFIIAGLDGVAQCWERHPEMPRSTLVEGVTRLLWSGLGRAE
ncbi:TetR/AcrR family transcriptional regulator [Actinomadura sp. NTSP31]|uniref:TetR/AcrR family transcriptional regulator n=1 Tax=Actinomadura sp. NTSP31 TaxID=1735447 RepID=UPI0035C146F5